MILQKLYKRNLISPPKWLIDNTHYLTMMGSVAYGVSTDYSDIDIYGFCVPKKDMIFTHLRGEIPGFGKQIKRFEQWQEHHIDDKDAGKEYDFSIYSIVKYFQLAMENNPNMIDSLFTPNFCVVHSTQLANTVRENRKLFLHKGCWHKFKGYAYSQLHKAKLKEPQPGSKRAKDVEEFGFDRKYCYHVVRLISECEQILTEHDLDLQRNREQLKAIRRGEMSLEEVQRWFSEKEYALEKLYNESTLRYSPDEDAIKTLLLNCLEEHYGTLENAIVIENKEAKALSEIKVILDKYNI